MKSGRPERSNGDGGVCDFLDCATTLIEISSSRSRDAAKATVRNQIDRQADQRIGASRALSQENAWPVVADCAGHWRRHWIGNFHRHRHRDRRRKVRHLLDSEYAATGLPGEPPCVGGPAGSGSSARVLHHAGSDRVCLHRPVLCGIGLDDSDCRERLHLRHDG